MAADVIQMGCRCFQLMGSTKTDSRLIRLACHIFRGTLQVAGQKKEIGRFQQMAKSFQRGTPRSGDPPTSARKEGLERIGMSLERTPLTMLVKDPCSSVAKPTNAVHDRPSAPLPVSCLPASCESTRLGLKIAGPGRL